MSQSKKDFSRVILASIDPISCEASAADAYLAEQGLNPAAIRAEGMKRIKRLQLQVRAEQTRVEMANTEKAKQQAMQWVDELLSNIDFSFPAFVKNEKLVLQNRNLDSLTHEDVKGTLVEYFYLKFLSQQDQAHGKQV